MDGTEPSTPATKAPVKTFPSREDKEFTKKVTGLIRSAFVALGKNKSFQGFWLADASIAKVINDKYRFSSVTTLDKTLLNKAVKPHVESQDMAADARNGDSIHSVTKRIPGVGRVMFYYFTPNAQGIKKPSYPGNLDGDRMATAMSTWTGGMRELSHSRWSSRTSPSKAPEARARQH